MHYSLVVKGARVVKGVKVNSLAASYHHSAFGFSLWFFTLHLINIWIFHFSFLIFHCAQRLFFT